MKIDTFFNITKILDHIVKAYPVFGEIPPEYHWAEHEYNPFEICEIYVKHSGDLIFIRLISFENGMSMVIDGDPTKGEYQLLLEVDEETSESWDTKVRAQDLIMIEYVKNIDGFWRLDAMTNDQTGEILAAVNPVKFTGKPILEDIYDVVTGLVT